MHQGGLRDTALIVKQPLVSVICVTFNAVKTLPDLITSFKAHKNDSVELIIIDGNSTDETINVLNENKDSIDFWISEPDNGIYDAMNKSLKYAKGKWFIFLGADDTLNSGFGEMTRILEDPAIIYYGNVIFYGKPFFKVYDDYYLTKLNICHQAIFYPKAVFEKYKYDLKYNVYADYHLNLRCWKDPQFKFVHADYLIASFPEGGFSSFAKDPAFERDKDSLFKKYLKPSSYYRYLNRSIGFFGMLKRFLQNK